MELSDEEIDAAILSFAEDRWLKVARIAWETFNALGVEGNDHERAFTLRVQALVHAGKLESQGDLSRWRYSEIRRPSSAHRA